MGQRFKQFRELVGKSKEQMEQEANHPCIKEKKINQFEYGAIIPDIVFVQYFTEEYGLNLTWLVTGSGFIFAKKGDKTPGDIYRIFRDINPTNHLINEIIGLNKKTRTHISRVNNQFQGGYNGTIFSPTGAGNNPGTQTTTNDFTGT